MKRQIKIILDYEEEGIDSDTTGPFRKVVVYQDDEPIGCIQNLKLSVSADSLIPEFEITFPDLHDPEIDASFESSFIKNIDYYVRIFSQIAGVKVILKPLESEKNVVAFSEVGTNGYIELVPMKSRHNP